MRPRPRRSRNSREPDTRALHRIFQLPGFRLLLVCRIERGSIVFFSALEVALEQVVKRFGSPALLRSDGYFAALSGGTFTVPQRLQDPAYGRDYGGDGTRQGDNDSTSQSKDDRVVTLSGRYGTLRFWSNHGAGTRLPLRAD
jgi:hypothetical protein